MLFPHSEHWMHRPFISEYACRMLVNVLVTSRLDYGNALLYRSEVDWERRERDGTYGFTRSVKYTGVKP
jgi:hypothetical protein